MATEFSSKITLDAQSAIEQMRRFSKESKVASRELKQIQNEVKSTAQGLSGNIFRKYIEQTRRASVQTEKIIANMSELRVGYSKLSAEQKSVISQMDRLNQKYDDSARAEAKLMQVRKEMRQLVASGLKTQSEANKIISREAIAIRSTTTAYKEKAEAVKKANQLASAQKQRINSLRQKYDSLYNTQVKERQVIKELNLLKRKGIITEKQYTRELDKQRRVIKSATSDFQKFAGAQAMASKAARLVSVYSRLFLAGLVVGRLVKFISGIEATAEKIQLLSDKLSFLTGDSGAYNKLFEMTQDVGIQMEAANKIITRFAVVTNRAFSIETMNEWTSNLIKSARATGTSTQEMSGALIQITQAMSAGRLMGDEYRSVTENLPLLTVALRDVFGKSTMSLKELSSQGLITNEKLIEGFERLKEIVAGFPDSTQTLEAAIGRISSAWDNFLSKVGNSGYTKAALNYISESLNMAARQYETMALNEESEKLYNATRALRSTENNLKRAQDRLTATNTALSKATTENDIKRLQNQQASLGKQISQLNKQRNDAERELRVLTGNTDEDYAKRQADFDMQAQRERDAAFKEELKSKELIEKIDKGKSIQKIKLETQLLRQQITYRATLAKEAGKIDPVEENRLYLQIVENEEEAINKVLKTKIDGQLRLKGLKTKFDIETIESEISKNSKILEIEKQYAKRVLQVKSAVEAGKLEEKEGVAPEFREGIGSQKGDRLKKSLKEIKDADIAKEIRSIDNAINNLLITADKTTATISKDKLGLADIEKSAVNQEFEDSILRLRELIDKSKGSQDELNSSYEQGYQKLKATRDLKLSEVDIKLNESLQSNFSQQSVASKNYLESLSDLSIAKERLAITDEEYIRSLRTITLEYDIQINKARALTGELSGLEQVHKGLEDGARNFMENTGTMYDFYADSTEQLLDSSIDLIIDHSKSAQEAFKNLVRSMLVELQKLIIKRSIIQAFGGFGVSTFGIGGGGGNPAGTINAPNSSRLTMTSPYAKGGTISGAGISAYSGSVVSKPTLFPFAKGIGLMGEAGDEAILPLKRGSDGSLGVTSNGSGGATVVVNNYSGSNVKTETEKDSGGKDIIKVIVEDAISGMVQNGKFDTMMSPYNISRAGAR